MDFKFEDGENLLNKNMVTIMVQKRNGKKCITSVIGMAEDLDLKKIISYIKKKYSCNGSVVVDEEHGEVMIFTGDQKENIYNFLVDQEINKKDEIILKGI
jgi:translation initiation factor 1